MLLSSQEIKGGKDDSKEFIALINKIISTMVFQYGIQELHYTKIKNWFDHQWLNFSGKGVVNFDGGGILPDASLEEKWQQQITVPPFHPRRILHESYVQRTDSENKLIRRTIHTMKSSNNNLHNRITNYSKNGLFVWYSSQSDENKRGSLMVYRVQENEIYTFYASFINENGWKIIQTKGIGLNELKVYISDSRP